MSHVLLRSDRVPRLPLRLEYGLGYGDVGGSDHVDILAINHSLLEDETWI